ncbi:MAG TPA: asparagine synthetase B [Bacteroidota bacterium]|nr:asparagine synthetase B [Bacteroidota bacterium]
MKRMLPLFLLLLLVAPVRAQQNILIPMDLQQSDHLKAYGIVYWVLTRSVEVDWLLNYRGGSFLMPHYPFIEQECRVRGVAFSTLDGSTATGIIAEVEGQDSNSEVVRLEKAPKIAVYVPPNFQPWDDAVTLAMEYAEVPYDKVWDEEVLRGKLAEYDWLHLHHEDFTGQYGKFYAQFGTFPWYIQQVAINESTAKRLGYSKVSEMKKAVARAIREYVGGGGFMFAMCSATDTYDIALAAEHTDICDRMFDGDPPDPDCQQRLDYSATFAFTDFKLVMNPYEYEYSDIDMTPALGGRPDADYFTLFDFSAKYDPVPSMLTQNHVNVIAGFLGQTTAFKKDLIKKHVVILGQKEGTEEVKYLHGNFGRGTFTWYGGHDPEDYQHRVGDPPTDLSLHKTSPGYRLILNNILFPAAKKKQQKT